MSRIFGVGIVELNSIGSVSGVFPINGRGKQRTRGSLGQAASTRDGDEKFCQKEQKRMKSHLFENFLSRMRCFGVVFPIWIRKLYRFRKVV